MPFRDKKKKTIKEALDSVNVKKNNTINVLFCGGRRVGKTSIMAAMEANMQDRFPSGTITLNVPDSGKLAANRDDKNSRFLEGNDGHMTFYADEGESASSSKNEYRCKVGLNGKAGLGLNFIDIPGEWFTATENEEELLKTMKSAQILVIAVDSPHLTENIEFGEDYGHYHEVFNRAPEVTRFVEKTLQGDNSPRLILFVPVKCELYKNKSMRNEKENMHYLLDLVKKGYSDLIEACKTANCAIVCAPCITMGGLEFLQFVPKRTNFDISGNVNDGDLETDEYGQPLADIITDENGVARMTYLSEYIYLYNINGRRYYAPEDCDQPLNYILLFLFGVGKMRKKNILSGIVNRLFQLPDQEILDSCKSIVKPKIKTDPNEGFEVINDPYDMF